MKLQEIERKVAALALDAACQGGELESSAVKFFILLKKRGIKIEEFDSSNGSSFDSGILNGLKLRVESLERENWDLASKVGKLTDELSKRPIRFVHPRKAEVTGKVYDSMPFGKHAGKKFKDVSREYLEWVVQNVTSNPDLVRSIREYLERTA